MSRFREFTGPCLAPIAVALVLAVGGEVLGVGIYDYQVTRSFDLPSPNALAGGQVLFDSMPSGRWLLLNGPTVLVETGLKTGAFTSLGSIPGFAPSVGPTFLAVSPDGRLAVAGTRGV